eukprot:g3789.t1
MAFWKPGSARPSLDRESDSFVVHNALHKLPISSQRKALPIAKHRDSILFAVEKYQVVIVTGDTGCGKSTQIPQYLSEAGWTADGRVVCCAQPSRVSAISISRRVAEELNVDIGEKVGYAVRYDQKKSSRTRLVYMSYDRLIHELGIDPLLHRYSIIMLDEVHERTISCDIALGLLKRVLRERPIDFRVIVASATLNIECFKSFFENGHTRDATEALRGSVTIVKVGSAPYPVELQYLEKPTNSYTEMAVRTALDIHLRESPGDILVFMPGAEEVEDVCRSLRDRYDEVLSQNSRGATFNFDVIPMYRSLPVEQQMNIFKGKRKIGRNGRLQNSNRRRCIVATNIAEMGVTIPGIRYVVDSGFVKLPVYSPSVGASLVIQPCSQSECVQRAGRAGRESRGKCFRLFTEKTFMTLERNRVPGIQRTHLAKSLLQLKTVGVDDVLHFDYISPPPSTAIATGLELLFALGIIDESTELTVPLGKQIVEFPIDPCLAKVLLSGISLGCPEEALTLVSMLSVKNVWLQPNRRSKDMQNRFAHCQDSFSHPTGDHMTYIQIFNRFQDEENSASRFERQNNSAQWCRENLLDRQILTRAAEIRRKLSAILRRFQPRDYVAPAALSSSSQASNSEIVLQCLISGFFANIAHLLPSGSYRTIREKREVILNPLSVLNRGILPKWVIFSESLAKRKTYITDVSVINPLWLAKSASHFYDVIDENIDAKTGERKSDFTNRRSLRADVTRNPVVSGGESQESQLSKLRKAPFSGIDGSGSAGGGEVIGGIRKTSVVKKRHSAPFGWKKGESMKAKRKRRRRGKKGL